jgi:hypothetical protein
VGTDLHELVDAGQPADRHPVTEVHMAPQRGVVRQRGVVVHLAIVRDMAVGHDPVVASDARDATGPLDTQVDGAELANGVAVADVQLGALPRVFFVLGNGADRVELEDLVVLPDAGLALNDTVRADPGAPADADVRADNGVRADGDRWVDLGLGVHQRGGVNGRHGDLLRRCDAWYTSVRPRRRLHPRLSRGP